MRIAFSSRAQLQPVTEVGLLAEGQIVGTTLNTFSAKDAKARFGELLDAALGNPVGITKHERLTAYVVSKRDFEAMIEKIAALEDALWLEKARIARESGFALQNEVSALLRDFGEIGNEAGNNKTSAQGN